MRASDDYKRKAADCLTRANATIDPNERTDLIVMALQWTRLAEQVARPGRMGGAAEPQSRRSHAGWAGPYTVSG